MEGSSNFDFLAQHDALLLRLAHTAEASFVPDPNTTMVKLRQLGEALVKDIAARVGIEADPRSTPFQLLNDIHFKIGLDQNILDAFHEVRKLGNQATHDFTSRSHRDAKKTLRISWMLSTWYHITFGGEKAKGFKRKPFVNPADPSERVRGLEERIQILEKSQQRKSERLKVAEALQAAQEEKAEAESLRADEMAAEREIWEKLATESEAKIAAMHSDAENQNKDTIKAFKEKDSNEQSEIIQTVKRSAFDLSEADTRLLIDQQLMNAGWLADTENLTYANGARPEHSVCQAIAEWPTESGPADYVLFDGLKPIAVVEAKRTAKNVYSTIDQAKRYARGIQQYESFEIQTTWGEYKVPVTFATNGRPYLKQLEQENGIWFLDIRNSSNRRKALKGWYSPEELKAYLKQTPQAAEQKLDEMDFNYNLELRYYQKEAIKEVEKAIKQGAPNALVAMATGTGKTKTSIALCHRLLKAERFRRILFLVDRSALGVQATDDFGEVRLEGLNTFADTFVVAGMVKNKPPIAVPESSTKVHVATVQGLVKRILYTEDSSLKPGIGQYDCVIVDECHRGYLLDRELSDTEINFRDQSDYQSKYRAVIEYFDAFKIGLTATPALHTTDIFGKPVYSYSYTEAVLDGFLNDHLPPIRIHTKLAEQGIHYGVGEKVEVYNVKESKVETYETPDELEFDVSQFNRKIIAPENTNVIAKWLIESDSISPYLPAKTLIFCTTDKHADQVVEALKKACENYHGEVEDDAIQKITGASDKPLDKILSYKNDRLPNIAVTVDLLTTGVDVPKICNLVFLRRVNSRILFEQMLGRATRLCDEIAKGPFRIYDGVDIYKQLENVNTMKPVVTNVDVTFAKLEQEFSQTDDKGLHDLARNQFIAKLQVKRRHLSDEQQEKFEIVVGKPPAEFVKELKDMPIEQVAQWFTNNPGLGEILDESVSIASGAKVIVLSDEQDEVIKITTGYGDGQKPEDYLQAFSQFVNANSNKLVAIQTVVQKPWVLSRKDLKALALELEKNHFREKDLQVAWREVKNEDITARIIGFIRQAALGEALIPFEQRVDRALEKILASQEWKTPQKQWLEIIAKQMKATTIVDEVALDEGIFKHQGGIQRANKLFEKPIQDVLQDFNRALWSQ